MATNGAGTRLASFLLAAAAPMLIGATGLTTNFDDRVLETQNLERTQRGIEPLRWSAALAESAQRRAEAMARARMLEHEPTIAVDPEGENLWAGTRGHYSPEAMAAGWIREKRYFRPGVFPDNSTTGRVKDVGHYTQMVWRDTGEVGCAVATGPTEDVMVCRYSAAGNYRGERPF